MSRASRNRAKRQCPPLQAAHIAADPLAARDFDDIGILREEHRWLKGENNRAHRPGCKASHRESTTLPAACHAAFRPDIAIACSTWFPQSTPDRGTSRRGARYAR